MDILHPFFSSCASREVSSTLFPRAGSDVSGGQIRGQMARVYVPYSGSNPAAIDVKGHRVLIIASAKEDLRDIDELVGASEIREFQYRGNDDEALTVLARQVNGGVIVSPPGVSLSAMIVSLEQELPWIH